MVKRDTTIFERALIALRKGYFLDGVKRNVEQILFILVNFKNPLTAIKDYYGRLDGLVTYHLREGTKLKVRAGTDDLHVILEIFQYGPYDFEERFDTLVDVGAHIGIFTVWAANKVGKVYALEPFKENYELLLKNIRLNKLKNVVPISKALTPKNKKMYLYLNRVKPSHNSFYMAKEYDEKVLVEGISLATFFRNYSIKTVDYLKMDVEGGEFDIFKSFTKQQAGKIRQGVIELHTYFFDREIFLKMLRDKGFETELLFKGAIARIKQK
jgi:FkbM family methyltransferase